MPYYIDDKKITLHDLLKRLQSSDLVPSRAPLLDNVEEKLTALGNRAYLHWPISEPN
jgi:hypothetical protein